MFEREHHVRVAALLEALDPAGLSAHACLFGGGTAISLGHGEYRESRDVDFLVSELPRYRELRERLTADGTLEAITRAGTALRQARELRADQHGIRTMVRVGTVEIKFEIVFERRVALEAPGPGDRLCGVATLTTLDQATTKLLANSDRWADDSVYSRDLIDLAMLDATTVVRTRALEKARGAYGDAVLRDLKKAVERLGERPGRLDECVRALKIDSVPKAVLWRRIRKLVPRAGAKRVKSRRS